MAERVILLEHDEDMAARLAAALRATSDFTLAATYHDAISALGKGGVFRPHLCLIDVENEDALEHLPDFAEHFPTATILGLMEEWNADTAERVLAAGGTGCILKPFQVQDLLDAIALYKRRGQPKPSRTLTFFSPKGRAGRTTLAAVLAIELARLSGESVALIDADLQFGDLSMFFDINPPHSIIDAAHDIKLLTPATFAPYFHPLGNNVWLLSSPDRPEYAELVDAEGLIEVIRMASNLFRFVLVDLPAGFSPISIALCEFADTDFLVTMINSGQEVRHVRRSMRMFALWESYGKHVHTVFTRVNPCTTEEKEKLERELGHPVSDILPNEYQMTAITGAGRLMKELPRDTLLIKIIGYMAEDIINGRR